MNTRAKIIDPLVVRAYQRARAARDAMSAHCHKSPDGDEWRKEFDRLNEIEGREMAGLLGTLDGVIDVPKNDTGRQLSPSHHPASNGSPIGRRSAAGR